MSTVVVALGGNALLRRSEPMTADVQRRNIERAAHAIAPVVPEHRVVVAHGNGPQVGLLALQAEAYAQVDPYPLDVLGAETEGMIGYMIEQELGNLLPPETPLATLLTMIEVDPQDMAFEHPEKFVGPVYRAEEARQVATSKHWAFRQDGSTWRRVVPSPQPRRIFEIRPVKWLLEQGVVVICAGGGGVRGLSAIVGAHSPRSSRADAYLTSVSSLNIGRYIEITMIPTITPTPIIINGSMIEVSAWIDASTSSS